MVQSSNASTRSRMSLHQPRNTPRARPYRLQQSLPNSLIALLGHRPKDRGPRLRSHKRRFLLLRSGLPKVRGPRSGGIAGLMQ